MTDDGSEAKRWGLSGRDDWLVTGGFTVLLLPATWLAAVAGGVIAFQTDRCSWDRCEEWLIELGAQTGLVGPAVILLAALLGVLVQWRRRRATWWVPLVGLVLLPVPYFVGNAIAAQGLPG